MSKNVFREQLLRLRRALSQDERSRFSSIIQQTLLAEEKFRRAGTVALYSPIDQEVETGRLAEWGFRHGKCLVYPRICGEHLEFARLCSPDEMRVGRFGVQEPECGEVVPLAEIEVMVVPGVGFDEDGCRLGYGKGYYDRALHQMPGVSWVVGLGYEFQVMPALPRQSHDQSLHALITERRILHFNMQIPPSA
ncbi:MAG: 5-formyltetrahydrofolate cyclo-ligase [Desulfuromonas sp.]|nr:MAG: 5-formyltetrahydrofolate cyclo-ligase [Desulfuromonas sp.]